MTKMMNGIRGNSGNEVKYPVNCAARVSSAAYGAGSMGMSSPDLDDLYEPRPNKRFFRVVTVIGYMFSISFGKSTLLFPGFFFEGVCVKTEECCE